MSEKEAKVIRTAVSDLGARGKDIRVSAVVLRDVRLAGVVPQFVPTQFCRLVSGQRPGKDDMPS